jgi:hypothetical protein
MDTAHSGRQAGKVLTASLLRGGSVVFLARNGRWSDAIDHAAVALEPVAMAALEARGREAEAANVVTGAYLIDVERHAGRVVPVHIRERIRALGPSVRPDLALRAVPALLAS